MQNTINKYKKIQYRVRHKFGDVTELPYQFSISFLVEFSIEKWSTTHRQSCSSQSAQQLCLWVVEHISIENSTKNEIENWYGNSVKSHNLWYVAYRCVMHISWISLNYLFLYI